MHSLAPSRANADAERLSLEPMQTLNDSLSLEPMQALKDSF